MGDWEDIFGAGYTFEQFDRDYLRVEDEEIKREKRYVYKGAINRKKKINSLYIKANNKIQRFKTYQEALSWAKKNPERSFRYKESEGLYVESRYYNHLDTFFRKKKL